MTFLQLISTQKQETLANTLREKCPNTEVLQVRISPHSKWICADNLQNNFRKTTFHDTLSLSGYFIIMSMWLRDLIYDMEAVLSSFRRCSLVVIKKAATGSVLYKKVLLKRRLWHRRFLASFAKYLRTAFLQNIPWQLLLSLWSTSVLCEDADRKFMTLANIILITGNNIISLNLFLSISALFRQCNKCHYKLLWMLEYFA